jgi:hypothetical protein
MTPGTPFAHVPSWNQLRQKIGVVYGNPETTTGGNALKFDASVRLDIRKTGVVKNGEQAVGNKTRVKVVKNKVAPPFRECEFEILYGSGVSATGEVVDLASEAGLLEKAGAHYSWNGERIAQGRAKACQYMAEHPELMDELRDKLVALRKAETGIGRSSALGQVPRRPRASSCRHRTSRKPSRWSGHPRARRASRSPGHRPRSPRSSALHAPRAWRAARPVLPFAAPSARSPQAFAPRPLVSASRRPFVFSRPWSPPMSRVICHAAIGKLDLASRWRCRCLPLLVINLSGRRFPSENRPA